MKFTTGHIHLYSYIYSYIVTYNNIVLKITVSSVYTYRQVDKQYIFYEMKNIRIKYRLAGNILYNITYI